MIGIPEGGKFLDCCCCFLDIRFEADFRTAPGAIVGVVVKAFLAEATFSLPFSLLGVSSSLDKAAEHSGKLTRLK